MIEISNLEAYGWEAALRGMRNPKMSHAKSDSCIPASTFGFNMGHNDMILALAWIKAGTEHRKFLRQISVWADITAPDYWWKEYDTYKVGTTGNSSSTMHKITSRELTVCDFSFDNISQYEIDIVVDLNDLIEQYKRRVNSGDKETAEIIWRKLIQRLPMSYNYHRTVSLNYEVVLSQLHQRDNHKLQEWREYREIMLTLPYMKDFYDATAR